MLKYLIVSWHQNNQVLTGISGVGIVEVSYISHYSFMAAKFNLDSAVSHIKLRDTTSLISYFILSPFK